MRNRFTFILVGFVIGLSAQTSTDADCDALCQEYRRLETVKMEYEKAMKGVENDMKRLSKRQDDVSRAKFEAESEAFQKAMAELNHQKAIQIAAVEKVSALSAATLIARFKAKWEYSTYRESAEKCIDKCIIR